QVQRGLGGPRRLAPVTVNVKRETLPSLHLPRRPASSPELESSLVRALWRVLCCRRNRSGEVSGVCQSQSDAVHSGAIPERRLLPVPTSPRSGTGPSNLEPRYARAGA